MTLLYPFAPPAKINDQVLAAFPEYPPYEGVYPDPIPHLTIGDERLSGPEAKRAAEQAVQPALPLTTRIDRFQLIAGTPAPSSFRVLEEFVLPGNI